MEKLSCPLERFLSGASVRNTVIMQEHLVDVGNLLWHGNAVLECFMAE
jgi:hypothetical protein